VTDCIEILFRPSIRSSNDRTSIRKRWEVRFLDTAFAIADNENASSHNFGLLAQIKQ
jgi:hypothetical protein